MALPVSDVTATARSPHEPLEAEAARVAADVFLIMEVGDLLAAQNPRLTAHGRWEMDVTLSNTVRGDLGKVGTISVDAGTGKVWFSQEERAEVTACADRR